MNNEGTKDFSLHVPVDLSQWFARERLVQWIRKETEEARLAGSELPFPPRSGPGWRVLLRVLLLAYSTQLMSNNGIGRECREDCLFRELAEGQVPFPEELEDFRRHHHPLLQELLARLYWRAICERRARLHQPPPEPIPSNSLRKMAEERIRVCAVMDTWAG